MEKKYRLPAVAWLKVTDYMHGWLQSELGGAATIKEQRVLCIQHLPGVKEVMKMETQEDSKEKTDVSYAMSSSRHNCIEAGLKIDALEVEKMYGINKESLNLYAPIECPKMCMTRNGVLRPWTLNTGFSREQAGALLKLLRDEFWDAVAEFDKEYARIKGGKRYTAKEMMEAFCTATKTSDVYLDAMRREWQRRVKRTSQSPTLACSFPQTSPRV